MRSIIPSRCRDRQSVRDRLPQARWHAPVRITLSLRPMCPRTIARAIFRTVASRPSSKPADGGVGRHVIPAGPPVGATRSPAGPLGVMMHVADDPALHELRPKGSHSKTYLGLEAPPGHVQGREILSVNEREMVMRYVTRPTTPRHLRLAGQKGDTHETLRAGSGFRRQFPTASNKEND